MKLRVIREVEASYVEITIPVRDEDDMPSDSPLLANGIWKATVNVSTGQIFDWPEGETLEFYIKVVDRGIYILKDIQGNQIGGIVQDYVPHSLIPGEYGDYIELKISDKGVITNWPSQGSLSDFEDEMLRDTY